MFFSAFIIGLREGLEAALIIGILLAYLHRINRADLKRTVWLGALVAAGLSLAIGALATFGRYKISFAAQEIIGGSLSILAVIMITWMIFWMTKTGSKIDSALQANLDKALALGSSAAIFWISFTTVAREGIESALLLWAWSNTPEIFTFALVGIASAVGIGALINRGVLKFNISTFFTATSALLLVIAGGVLAYGVHDLQEAAILPGPFSGHPVTPTDLRTGEVLTGFDGPFWAASYPFGWAFNLEHIIVPDSPLAAILKGTIGFTPQMSWLEVTAWLAYMSIFIPAFIRTLTAQKHNRRHQFRGENKQCLIRQPE